MEETFDYVIVGGGSAGCVLANRLSRDPARRVLLLEAGHGRRPFLMRMPLGFLKLIQDPAISWGYTSEPEPFAGGRRLWLPRGKMLGGCSSINGMLYSRADPRDYDEWSSMGLAGWSFAEVLPYFRRAESSWHGDSAFHGADGPLSVTGWEARDGLLDATFAAVRARGYPVHEDHHASLESEGFAPPEGTIHHGERGSADVCYLRPVMARPNLTVRVNAQVMRVVIQGTRAIGVEYEAAGRRCIARAECEVLLSAGAYNSPQLLLLSGVGPADELRALGIAPRVDSPQVGRNLQEHATVALGFAARPLVGFEPQLRMDRITLAVLQWLLMRSGPATRLPITCMGFIRTRSGLDRPDVKVNLFPTNMDARVWLPWVRPSRGANLAAFDILLRPKSRGRMILASADPRAAPRIFLNVLAEREDMDTLIRAFRWTRELHATEPLSGYIDKERLPGTEVNTDEQIEAYIRSTVAIAHHPAGTCAMGADSASVVDAELRVRGLEGLRVVDASVMPRSLGGNTNAPIIMIAEKAADLILGRPALPPAVLPR
ncbi:MAG TPA: GMC family oxidoreductase N-terminal domain-containing protein [Steroidobacteraceae bacterium]|nr:GMC family oxidoreductase N-terminal domain-containing protein [Steroidobacteraceae bacterium]